MNQQVKSLLKIIAAVFTISVGAQLTVNAGSIPITGQTLAILSWAFFLTPREAIISLCSYLLLGFSGIPIFADGAFGIEKLYGGSGGYLIGFLIAAVLVSYLFRLLKSSAFYSILFLTTIGTAVILTFGIGRLMMLYGFEKGLEYGFYPFWKGALVKILLGSLLVWVIKRFVTRSDGLRFEGMEN